MSDLNSILPTNGLPKSQLNPFRVLGIDLGTTNCTVAEIVQEQDSPLQYLEPECLEIQQPTLEGTQYTNILLPSILAIYQGKLYIGEGAKRLRARCGDKKSKLINEKSIFWEEKNYMGVEKTMHKAPQGYQHAREISGHILRYLYNSALEESDLPVQKTVITVPASFQLAQRQDTLKACELAGIDISSGDMLDEPIAAFLHFLFSKSASKLGKPGHKINTLIFDFGGGTCDIAIFRVCLPNPGESLQLAPLAVSRYHKLGGGDIDKAIIHEILIPQVLSQNQMTNFDLEFDEKKYSLEPALLSTAEMLKIGLCQEIDRLYQLGSFNNYDPEQISKSYPGVIECPLSDGRMLNFNKPCLSAAQFAQILLRFLDTDITYHEENEYRWICSVFGPLEDALFRANLEPKDIGFCLLVGGSSRIPYLRWALEDYFDSATTHAQSEYEIQTAVAQGACLHAFMLHSFGKSIVQPCSAESIFIQTQSGPQNLIPLNAFLPYPENDAWSENQVLTIPETSVAESLEVRIEIQDGQGEVLCRKPWKINPPVNKGEPILLKYQMDENQTLSMHISLPNRPEQDIEELELENPVTSVVNPNSTRQKILELEENMRTQKMPVKEQIENIIEIADLYEEIGQKEKSVSFYRKIVQKNGPDAYLLNKIGMLYGAIGDYKREEKYYLEADRLGGTWKGPLFNLALSYRNQGRYVEAAATLDKALKVHRPGPHLVLRAMIAEAMDDYEGKESLLDEALHFFAPVSSLDDWELFWYTSAVRMKKLSDEERMAIDERKKRRSDKKEEDVQGVLPGINAQPARI